MWPGLALCDFGTNREVSSIDHSSVRGQVSNQSGAHHVAGFTGQGQRGVAAIVRKDMAKQFRLLIVDDDAGIRDVTSQVFVEVGYRVETAVDGADALRVVDTFHPDLLITDLRMPGMSGFELLAIVREQFPQLPVIAISGEYSGDSLPQGVIADAFLCKGQYPISRLSNTVAQLLAVAPMRESQHLRS
jgi:CheY-like chemotaxis protein